MKESIKQTKDKMIGKYTDMEKYVQDAVRDIKSSIEALFIKV